MKKNLAVLALAFGIIVLAGCGNQQAAEPLDKHVKVGVIAPLSGPASTYGEDSVNSYELALAEIKEQYPDVTLEMIYEDGKCSGKDAVSAIQKLINIDQVDIILGGICSGETVAAGKIAQEKKVLMLSPTASAPNISDIGEYLFRFWNDEEGVTGLRKYMEKQGVANVGIIFENTEYADALQNEFATNFGGQVTVIDKIQTEEKSYDLVVKKLVEQEKFDALLFVTQTESTLAGLMNAMNDNGLVEDYRGKIYVPYLASSKAFLDAVGNDVAEGIIEVQIPGKSSLDGKAKSFIEKFEQNYEVKSIDFAVSLTREGMNLIADAANKGHTDTESMKQYFESFNKSNPRSGFFGEYYFDAEGDAVGLKFIMQQIQNGKAVILE